MEKFGLVIMLMILIPFTYGCKEENFTINCDTTGGVERTFIGKIYANNPFNNDFYIGCEDSYGGQIPCGGLPKKFEKPGMIVEVTGITAGTPPDTDDPSYGYIVITGIEEINSNQFCQ